MRTAELRTRSSHCSLAYLEREVLAKPMRMLCSSVQQCKCTNPARRLSLKQNKTRSPSSVPPSKVCAPRCLFVINQTIATRAHVCPSLQSGCQSLQRLGACGVQNLMLSEALSVCSLSPIAHMSDTTACLLREPRAPVESVCSAAPLVQESLKARATVAVQQQHDSVCSVCRCRVCRSKQREHTQLSLQLLAGPPLRPAQPIPTHAPQQGRPSWCHRRSVPHRLLPRRQLAWAQRRLRAPIRTNRWRRCAFAPRTPHGSTPRSCKEALPTASDEGTDDAGWAGLRIPREMARVATPCTTRAWHARPRGTALPVQARALVDGIQAARLCRVDAEGAAIAGRQAAALADSDPRVVQLQVCPDECARLCAARDPVSRSPLSSAQLSNATQRSLL